MHQNPSGGRAPPGPAGKLISASTEPKAGLRGGLGAPRGRRDGRKYREDGENEGGKRRG